MPTARHSAGLDGALTLAIEAEELALTVEVDEDLQRAEVELSGPAEVLDGLEARTHERTWHLRLPAPSSGGGVTTVTTGRGATTIVNGRAIQAGRTTRVVIGNTGAGDNVVINGVPQGPATTGGSEPVQARVRLPADSRLHTRITAGHVHTHGRLVEVDHHATAAALALDTAERLRAETISGDVTATHVTGIVQVSTTSGDIDLDCVQGPVTTASTSGDITLSGDQAITATTMSGDIDLAPAGEAMVQATSMSGDVTVTPLLGNRPQVQAHSLSGRVRTPA